VRRSAGACPAPRAAFTAAGGTPTRSPPGPLAWCAALAAGGDAPVRPCCAGASRAPYLAFPANAVAPAANAAKCLARLNLRLELELIQPHIAQKPVLRGEVGCTCVAREVSVERGGMGKRGCARRLGGWVWV